MTDEEILNKAKETSGGNYYYEQGFIYGFELGEENGSKEAETHLLEKWCRNKDDYCPHLKQLEKENEQLRTELNKYQKVTGELLSPINGILKTPHD